MKVFIFLLGFVAALGLVVFFGAGESSIEIQESEVTNNEPIIQITQRVEVYDGIFAPEDATILDVSGQGLNGSLKAEVRQLTQLELLDISNNQFTGVPAEVGQLSELRILNLANNPLTGLPHEIGNLQKLEELDVRGTQYSEQDLATIRARLPGSTVIFVD